MMDWLNWTTLAANLITIATGITAFVSAFPALRRIARASERSADAAEAQAAAANPARDVLLAMLYGHDETVAQLEKSEDSQVQPILMGLMNTLAGRRDVLDAVDFKRLKSRAVPDMLRQLMTPKGEGPR